MINGALSLEIGQGVRIRTIPRFVRTGGMLC